MGYTTEFTGTFWLNTPLEERHRVYLQKFNKTRRMRRDVSRLPYDPYRAAVGLAAGIEGEYFVAGAGFAGQDHDDSILNYNSAPKTQPGLWCQWQPNTSGTAIKWDGGEKFYKYEEWLTYLNENFFKPWGYVLDGSVRWQGEDTKDYGTLVMNEGTLSVHPGERIKSSKKIGYGGMKKRVFKEKPSVPYVSNSNELIALVREAYQQKPALLKEYLKRIDDTDPGTFLRITKEYVTLL